MISKDKNESSKFVDIDLTGYKELPIGEKFIPDQYRRHAVIFVATIFIFLILYVSISLARPDENSEKAEDQTVTEINTDISAEVQNVETESLEEETVESIEFKADQVWLREEYSIEDYSNYLDNLNRFQESSYKKLGDKKINGTLVSFQYEDNFAQFIGFELLGYCLDDQYGESECIDIYFIDSMPEDQINFYFVGRQFKISDHCDVQSDRTTCIEKELPLFIKEEIDFRNKKYQDQSEDWISAEMSSAAPELDITIEEGEFITDQIELSLTTVEATNDLLDTIWGEITLLVRSDGNIIKVVRVNSKV